MTAPLGVLPENLGAPTINAWKTLTMAPWEVLLENLGAPTINARKRQR
jgi:hypothetical protein